MPKSGYNVKRRSNLSVLLQCDCLRQVSPLFLIVALIRDEAATVGQQTDHQRSGGNTKYPSFTFFLVHECPPGRIMRLPSCATVSAVLINACWTRANAARRIVSPLRRFQVAKPAPPALAIGRMAASSSRVDLQLDMLGGPVRTKAKDPVIAMGRRPLFGTFRTPRHVRSSDAGANPVPTSMNVPV